MELQHSKRSLLQTALTSIAYRRAARPPSDDHVPDRPDPGTPAAEKGAILRAVAWDADVIAAAKRQFPGSAHEQILSALESLDPTVLIEAIYRHDRDESPAVRELILFMAAQRVENVKKAVDSIKEFIVKREQQLIDKFADEAIRNFAHDEEASETRLDRLVTALSRMPPAASVELMKRIAGATPKEIDHQLEALQKPPEQPATHVRPVRAGGRRPSQDALRKHAQRQIRARDFRGRETLGQRLDRVLRFATAHDLDIAPAQKAMKALGIHNPLFIDAALDVWQEWSTDVSKWATTSIPARPFGYLHLERLDFVPAGVEHGELIYSLPLAPSEEIAIVHKEWSNTNEEFEKIVSDQFEDYSEKGVVEHTDAASSSRSQAQHSSSFSLSMSASGGYGPISATAHTSYSAAQSDSQSRATTTRQSSENTKKASARSRKDHKVTVRLAKKTGVEDETVRRVKNPDPLHAVRYDYYQLMRKWRVDLWRYGIRLTYDLTIPEPAVDLLQAYNEIAELQEQIDIGFVFNLKPESVTRDNWVYLANQYGAKVEAPPPMYKAAESYKIGGPWKATEAHVDVFTVKAPEGYEYYDHWDPITLRCVEATDDPDVFQNGFTDVYWHGGNPYDCDLGFLVLESKTLEQLVSARVWYSLKDEEYQAWQVAVHEALREAAAKTYAENRQMLQDRQARLLTEVSDGDALTLRKLEREELMKNVIRWLFGPGFHFAPLGVPTNYFDPSGAVVNQSTSTKVLSHGRLISFLHQALEWENMNSFLYPYFWTPRTRWKERLRIRHADSIHEAFLRAGAARVVLPIRRGWENAFLALLSTGNVDSASHPYQTIAQEIENYAQTNYPGIPPANDPADIDPEKNTQLSEGKLITSWYEYTPTNAVDVKIGETVPIEGEYNPPDFAPPSPALPWYLDPAVGQAVASALAAVVQKLSPPNANP